MCVGVLEKAIVFTRSGQAVVKLNIIAGGDLDQLVKSLPNIFQDHRSICNQTIEPICYLYIIASEIKREQEKELMGVLCRTCEVSAIAESLLTNEDCIDNLLLIPRYYAHFELQHAKIVLQACRIEWDLYSLTHNCTCKCDAEAKHILNLFINENGGELLHQIIEE